MKKKVSGEEIVRNQLARALADYDNLRKRTETERELWSKFAGQKIINKLLPILDNFEAVQKHLKDQGLAIAVQEFKNVLKDEGIEEIKVEKGERFDENIHEAVEVVTGGKKGVIAELVLPGWRFSAGPVVRCAKVKVYDKDRRN